MADKNLEDGDIEPAPKLIQVVFQNCKGQVDHWVEPYLRITVERLRRSEKPYLKCLLIQVVICSSNLGFFICQLPVSRIKVLSSQSTFEIVCRCVPSA